MGNYDKLSQETFDRMLAEIMNEEIRPSALLVIPGIYEIVCEYYNNEILRRWDLEQDAEN